uniref:Uncharacterized protein n=1 Tax=Ciona savignyi TaxID=51511 RepID=H2YQI5_CIOSA
MYMICGVKLPNSESFNSKEDGDTSVALGYTAQLLNLISQFLLVPLRYQIIQQGSHSSIFDHVTDKLNEKERIFPIYVRGSKDRFLFEYGVFLLNKNIAQLRYYCGLGTQDLRPTLHNIRALLQDRLGAKPISLGSSYVYNSNSADLPLTLMGTEKQSDPNRAVNVGENLKRNLHYPSDTILQNAESRNTCFTSLRDELFGLTSEVKRLNDNLPQLNDPQNAPNQLRSLLPNQLNFKSESVDSILPNSSATRTQLTGLEEFSQLNESIVAKKNHASARAELFATNSIDHKSNQDAQLFEPNSLPEREAVFSGLASNPHNIQLCTNSSLNSFKVLKDIGVIDFPMSKDNFYMDSLSDRSTHVSNKGLSVQFTNSSQKTNYSQSGDLDLC